MAGGTVSSSSKGLVPLGPNSANTNTPWMYVDRKSTRLNSSHRCTSYAVVCLKKKTAVTSYYQGQEDVGDRFVLRHIREQGYALRENRMVAQFEAASRQPIGVEKLDRRPQIVTASDQAQDRATSRLDDACHHSYVVGIHPVLHSFPTRRSSD